MNRRLIVIASISLLIFLRCGPDKTKISEPSRTFPKDVPQELNYDNVSLLLEDMERFVKSLKPLNLESAKHVDSRYSGVLFKVDQAPLFLNVYPDPANARVVFLVSPKDPKTGSNALITFDKKLPVINESTVEIQIRTQSPDEPLTCLLNQSDPAAYVDAVRAHLFSIRYTLTKRFLQSGTFDFDALHLTTYRQRGYPFIVFELVKAELTDTTAKLSCECR